MPLHRLAPHAMVALATLLCAACAAPAPQASERADRVYRTGSNIAVREPSAPSNVQTVDPSTLQDAMRVRQGKPGTVSGN